jgi:hypothetical protein
VCQVHTAVHAVVQSWSLDRRSGLRLLARTADQIAYHQRRGVVARESHTRTTIRKLKRLGIKVDTLPRCDLDST